MAISGRLVTMAKKIIPPIASPIPKCFEIISIANEIFVPANQMMAEQNRNNKINKGVAIECILYKWSVVGNFDPKVKIRYKAGLIL